jgi:RsmE family RNA methyltransferase
VNLVLLRPDEIDGGEARLRDRRAAHLRDVIGAAEGSRVRVGVVRGPRGTARVAAARDGNGDVVLSLDALDQPATPRPPVDLVLAVPRPKALRRVLQSAAALGVGRIDLVNAWRVEKSFFHSPVLAAGALRDELIAGCEQGATTWVPDVAVHELLMPFVESSLSGDDDRARVLLHPHAGAAIETRITPGHRGRVVAAIGPEGGWIDRELATFEEQSFAAVHLGERVLRVETAVSVLLAQIALLRRL